MIFLIRNGDHCYAIRRVAVHLADSRKVARHLLGEHMANIAQVGEHYLDTYNNSVLTVTRVLVIADCFRYSTTRGDTRR